MSLIIAVVGAQGIHVASDYRLSTNEGTRKDETRVGVKQMQVHGFHLRAMVGYTGIARGAAYNTREWLAATIRSVGENPMRRELSERIVDSSGELLGRVSSTGRHLSILICGLGENRLFADLFSNFETLSGQHMPLAGPKLTWYSLRPGKPRVLVLGQWQTVARREKKNLTSALRSGRSAQSMQNLLAEVMSAAAQRGQGVAISPQCMTHSFMPNGESTSQNHGATPGCPDMIMAGMNIGEWLRHNLRSDDGSSNLFKGECPHPSGPLGGDSS